jgi:hypothetical protein
MKTKIITLVLMLACWASGFAQEYYYWYNSEKIPLELLPTKKFILVNSPEDSAAVRSLFIQKGFETDAFYETSLIRPGILDKFTDKELFCNSTVTGKDSLPDLTGNDYVLYEGPYFKYILNLPDDMPEPKPIGLTNEFGVLLKTANDFEKLNQIANENNVEILYNLQYMPLRYNLGCTKRSNGNALQMANLFQETGLFEWAAPFFIDEFEPYPPTYIDTPHPQDGLEVFVSGGVLYVNTSERETISIYSVSGALLHKTTEKQILLTGINSKILVVRGSSGWIKKIINR